MTTYLYRLNLSTVLDKLAGELGVGTEMLGTAGSLYYAACAVGGLINTVLLLAVLIMAINGCNWYTISYLPLFFTGKSVVAALACLFDFSTYLGASFTPGLLGFLLEQYG